MNKETSLKKKIRKLIDPNAFASDQNKNQLIYRNDYIELIKALTLFIFKALSDNYNFLPKNKRYYVLIPVLAHISGEWATYIVNYLYRLKEISKKDIDFLQNNTQYYLENNLSDLRKCNTFRDNTDNLKNSFFIRVLITHILLNKHEDYEINELVGKNKTLDKVEYTKKSKAGIKDFLRKIKNRNLICGYKNLSCLKVLIKTSLNDINVIYEKSIIHTNKFLIRNLKISQKHINKYFSSNQLKNIIYIIYLLIPSEIDPGSLKRISNKKDFSFFKVRFCGPYQRDLNIVKNLFIKRMNKKLIIGSQHGSDYGYIASNIKFQFSEFMLDGFISAGFNNKHSSWIQPFLGFIPTSPKFSKLEELSSIKANKKIISKSCLYIESQINLSKSMISDRMNYSLTYSKYNTYKLIKSFLKDLYLNKYNFDKIYIRPWIQNELLSPSKDSNILKSSNIDIVHGKLTNFLISFYGLIILDDLSTPMLECIAMGKPFIIIISKINTNTKFSEKFFQDMIKNKYIVFKKEDANLAIEYFLQNPSKFLFNQKKLCKNFKNTFCCPKNFKSIETANKINYLINLKKNT